MQLKELSNELRISIITPQYDYIKTTCLCEIKDMLIPIEYHSASGKYFSPTQSHICNLEKEYEFSVGSFLSKRVRMSYEVETSLRVCIRHGSVIREILLKYDNSSILKLSEIFKSIKII